MDLVATVVDVVTIFIIKGKEAVAAGGKVGEGELAGIVRARNVARRLVVNRTIGRVGFVQQHQGTGYHAVGFARIDHALHLHRIEQRAGREGVVVIGKHIAFGQVFHRRSEVDGVGGVAIQRLVEVDVQGFALRAGTRAVAPNRATPQ